MNWKFWKVPDLFYFSLRIPFISIHTETMCKSYERRALMYQVVYIKIWKWDVQFELGKKMK